jgi:hypothetical protein
MCSRAGHSSGPMPTGVAHHPQLAAKASECTRVQAAAPFIFLAAFSPGWWALSNTVAALLLSVTLDLSLPVIATVHTISACLRAGSLWLSLPVTLVATLGLVLCAILCSERRSAFSGGSGGEARGTFRPLKTQAPPGANESVTAVLTANTYYEVPCCTAHHGVGLHNCLAFAPFTTRI